MPWTDELMKEKVTDYEAKFGLPNVFGAIDGSYFKIKEPIYGLKGSNIFFMYILSSSHFGTVARLALVYCS